MWHKNDKKRYWMEDRIMDTRKNEFSDEELKILSKGVLQLISAVDQALNLTHDSNSIHALKCEKLKYQTLSSKIDRMQTTDCVLIEKAENFLRQFDLYQSFLTFCKMELVGKEMLHSDRWSAIFDWLTEKNLRKEDKPEAIESALTELYETSLGIKDYD